MFRSLDPYFKASARLLLTALFLWGGIAKTGGYAATQGYMEGFGIPGILLPLVILTELGGALALIAGWQTRLVSLALAGFCILSALIFHADLGERVQLIMFLKNLGLAGGFLALAVSGPGAWALDSDDS